MQTILATEDADAYLEFHKLFYMDLQPATATEVLLVERIITCAWRLERINVIESKVLVLRDSAEDNIGWTFLSDIDRLSKLNRYERNLERSMFQTMDRLEAEKRKRSAEDPDLVQEKIKTIFQDATATVEGMAETKEHDLTRASRRIVDEQGREQKLPPAAALPFLEDQILDTRIEPVQLKEQWMEQFDSNLENPASKLSTIVKLARDAEPELNARGITNKIAYNAAVVHPYIRNYVRHHFPAQAKNRADIAKAS